jgi:enoyl-CoA hydratase/carnithine racemase
MDQSKNRNVLSRRLCNDTANQMEEICAQDGQEITRALVIASSLDKAFFVVADLKERNDTNPRE